MSDWSGWPRQPTLAWPPFRIAFDAARDPLTARNALGILGTGGGGGAPTTAEYITASADATLSAERVLTNTASITWDFSTPGQAKASTTAGGGNVSNSGTPTVGQYAKWVTATTIQGVAPVTVLSDIGAQPAGSYQPLDADLTSLAAASATNAIYYRSAANTWATVTIGANLTFTGGTLAATVPAAFITSVSAPLSVTGTNLTIDLTAYAPLASPIFTGDPKAPTPATADNDTSIATTAFVRAVLGMGPLTTPGWTLNLSGTLSTLQALGTGGSIINVSSSAGASNQTVTFQNKATGPIAQISDNTSNSGLTSANYPILKNNVAAQPAILAVGGSSADRSLQLVPAGAGTVQAPTMAAGDSSTAIATTAFVGNNYQPLDADLTAIAALTGTNTIYYRSAANTWSAVTIGGNMTFSGGTLNSIAGGGGNVSNSGTPTAGQIAQWTDATHIAGISSATVGFGPPQGRLCLVGGPVMTASSSNQVTLYYYTYVGDMVPLYDGAIFTMTSIGNGLTATTTDTTKNPAAIGASKVNDWFVWNDAGTIQLGHGPDWTSDTARSAGTALVRINGIWLNDVSITNGPAARRGTYVGTTRSNASSTLDFIFASAAANGGAGFIGVWNAYNRVDVRMQMNDNTGTWTYATAAWRAAHNSATARVSFVSGLQEDGWTATYRGVANAGAGGFPYRGIGYDSTTVLSGYSGSNQVATSVMFSVASFSASSLGFHYASAIEYVSGGTSTFYGNTSNLLWQWLDFDWRC